MKSGDMELFGQLLYASHESLRDNYEVSGKELDTIVDFLQNYPGCMQVAGWQAPALADVPLPLLKVKNRRF